MKYEYITWNNKNKSIVLSELAENISKQFPVQRTVARDSYQNIAGNTSIREGFNRTDYEHYRRDEAVPQRPKDIIRACMSAYRRVGLIRNVIDLMSDFACQGIKIVHPNPTVQRYHDEWARLISFTERSERFINLLFRTANVIIQRTTAKLDPLRVKTMRKVLGERDLTLPELDSFEIPWSYQFLNPLAVDMLDEVATLFYGKPKRYVLYVPQKLSSSNLTSYNQETAIINSGKSIQLDPNRVRVFHYKKDDWAVWADPMIYAILDDIILLEKLKLADMAALDGAISHIRIWKLGSLEEKIIPNRAVMSQLAEMLLSNLGGGTMDLVWGPDIELLETGTEVYKFLGQEKYGPTLNNIYAGLGIPPTLTGSATASGFTNNFISLKTLTERLSYARSLLVEFWTVELRLMQQSLGFRYPASIVFDRMNLSDEAAEKALLIQLADRDLISMETILHRFGELPELEKLRLKRERRARSKGRLPRKASPWHNPEHKQKLEGIFAQTGTVTPSELGIELHERKRGEKPALVMKSKPVPSVQPGQPQPGRPKNSKDSTKRKQKRVVPRSKAELYDWAKHAQKIISNTINPIYLNSIGKNNINQLSISQLHNFERLKFNILCNLSSDTDILSLINQPLSVPEPVNQLIDEFINQYQVRFNRLPYINEMREIYLKTYSIYYGE